MELKNNIQFSNIFCCCEAHEREALYVRETGQEAAVSIRADQIIVLFKKNDVTALVCKVSSAGTIVWNILCADF